MIATLSNFQSGKYKLPNAKPAPNNADNTALIQEYIDKCEREVLTDSLGVELYTMLKAAYPLIDDPLNVRYKELAKGVVYEKESKQLSWEGLTEMLVPYIYYHYLTDQQDHFTTFGVERPEGVNSKAVSAIPKAVDAYRSFHSKYQEQYINFPNLIRRSAGLGIDWYGGNRSSNVSFYQFLKDNKTVYPEASFFVFKENINSFGI